MFVAMDCTLSKLAPDTLFHHDRWREPFVLWIVIDVDEIQGPCRKPPGGRGSSHLRGVNERKADKAFASCIGVFGGLLWNIRVAHPVFHSMVSLPSLCHPVVTHTYAKCLPPHLPAFHTRFECYSSESTKHPLPMLYRCYRFC